MDYQDGNGKRGRYDSLVGLAHDLVNAGTVNEVLHGVSVAYRARQIRMEDKTLEIAQTGGLRVGYLFKPEAERVFRKRPIGEDMKIVFERVAYKDENPARLAYTRENDLALVLSSNEFPYHDFGGKFFHFLTEHLGFRGKNIFSLRELSEADISKAPAALENSGRKATEADPFANVIVYYTGRSENGNLRVNEQVVKYSDWVKSFGAHKGNIAFVHDTSFAGALEPELEKTCWLSERAMFLGACGTGEEGVGNHFSRAVMRSYSSGNSYKPEPIEITPEHPVETALKSLGLPFVFVAVGSGGSQKKVKQNPLKKGINLDYLLIDYTPKDSLKGDSCFD